MTRYARSFRPNPGRPQTRPECTRLPGRCTSVPNVKIVLDTDCDLGDVDDALCLDYLLRRGDCELLGITTVAGDTVHQARVASMLCHAGGVDVPIRPGAPAPLLAPALPAKLAPQLPSL